MMTKYGVSLVSINILKRTCTGRERARERERLPSQNLKNTAHSINFLRNIMLPVSVCSKPNLKNTAHSINFLRNIMLPVSVCLSRCRSVLSGHNTTRDTRRQFQLAQPSTVPAHCTASTGWQPEHDT